jgi:dolichol-phosphate mannosyltransferase
MDTGADDSILIGLPAYNESKSIQPLIHRIKQLQNLSETRLEILLFDDGSIDSTANVFTTNCDLNNLAGTVIGDGSNHGLGFGLRSILSYFLQRSEAEFLVIMDCDDTHDPAQIMSMKQAAIDRDLDVVIASRYRVGSETHGVSNTRKIISSGAGIYLRSLFPRSGIRDFTCGFRLYRRNSIDILATKSRGNFFKRNGFSCMPEIILKLYRQGSRIGEIPLLLGYDRKVSESKMRFFKNIREILVLGIRIRVRLD